MKPRPRTCEHHALVRRTLDMYRGGWFPMHNPRTGMVEWVQPALRAVIPLEPERFHVSRSLQRTLRLRRFRVSTDQAFAQVIRACAAPAPGRKDTWLDDTIIELFLLMHRAGHAHSIEIWLDPPDSQPTHHPASPPAASGSPVLVGGIYGLSVGRVFAGESMFSRPESGGTDASKVALVHMVHHLRRRGFVTLDAQLVNPHLQQFGCCEVPREEFLRWFGPAEAPSPVWLPFEPEKTFAELG